MSVTYRPGSTRDRAALAALLTGLSPDSAYARFRTAIGAHPSSVLVDAMLPQPGWGGSVLAWCGAEAVGHGEWVRLGRTSTAEIALVVADGHRARGVGTTLARHLLVLAAARGIERIEMYAAADNAAIARMAARLGDGVEVARDGSAVTYAFALGAHQGGRAAA